jgi:hypothetical protein
VAVACTAIHVATKPPATGTDVLPPLTVLSVVFSLLLLLLLLLQAGPESPPDVWRQLQDIVRQCAQQP